RAAGLPLHRKGQLPARSRRRSVATDCGGSISESAALSSVMLLRLSPRTLPWRLARRGSHFVSGHAPPQGAADSPTSLPRDTPAPRRSPHRPVSSEPYLRRLSGMMVILGGCRNQRSSFPELMEPPRLSPVDEHGSTPSALDSIPLCSTSNTSLPRDAGPLRRWLSHGPCAGRPARTDDSRAGAACVRA